MRITAMMTIAALMGASGWAGESRTAAGPKVLVCMTLDQHPTESYQAQGIATRMFADIGVQVEWRTNRHSCPANGAIVIKLTEDTPHSYLPRALAFALPYERVHIRVFYDRINKAVQPPVVPCLLAHVLVHEITHILEGIDRHSDTGVMKAYWSETDYVSMAWKPLAFAERDVLLIHRGLEARAARVAAGDVPTPMTAATQ